LTTDPVPPALAVRPAPFAPDELAAFKAAVGPLVGLDLGAYKPRQMERRITALLYRSNARSLDELRTQLETSPQRLQAFVDGLTINVSEFLRNPERFAELGERILPDLLARHGTLRIWSAGCSMGAELYSVGMWLEKLGMLDRCELVGTDLDRAIVARAEAGLYGPHEIQGVPEAWRERYFVAEGAQFRFTGDAIRARSRFACHNLLADPPVAGCHLILCRNVVIYLNEASKQQLYRGFQQALVPGGVLFVGNTERIFGHRELGFEALAPFFYRKPDGPDAGKEA
jgi:chemotaxis protein methyltransferase CheR